MQKILKILICIILFQINAFPNDSSEAIIIIQPDANKIELFAANELEKHLELILNEKVTITKYNKNLSKYKYKFYIGREYIGKMKFKKEEAIYKVQNDKIYLSGDDLIINGPREEFEAVSYMQNKTGTLSAVYDFLHNELGVRWFAPGDSGIYFVPTNQLNLKNLSYSWYPTQSFRKFRNDIWLWKKLTNSKIDMYTFTPNQLQFTKNEVEQKEIDELIWMRRMKQGANDAPNYGHAFTDYWYQYGYDHPEWFALGTNGKRGLDGRKDKEAKFVKFCVTNTELQNEIVKRWNQHLNDNDQPFNACINDGTGYCQCSKCRALDGDHKSKPSSNFEKESKTDRYIYFWNALQSKAKKINSKSRIIAYAYDEYRYPPKKQFLSTDIILGFVPKFSDLPKETEADLVEWKAHGLKEVFLRPNDFNDDIGMPMGHEKFIFDKLNQFKVFNVFGIDYDRNYNLSNWHYEGITYYILAQSIADPLKTFNTLENEYYDTFENSKNDIQKYYQYWRNTFEKRRLPVIKQYGGFEGRRNILQNIDKFYTLEDFKITDDILRQAFNQTQNKKIRDRINRLIIANTHSKLLFLTLKDRNKYYTSLLNYRIKYKDELNLCWPMVFFIENNLVNLDGKKSFLQKLF